MNADAPADSCSLTWFIGGNGLLMANKRAFDLMKVKWQDPRRGRDGGVVVDGTVT